MKLSLQHLKRLLANGKSKENDQFEKPIDNLLYQIETLNDIASSFSAFAKMPIPENERFEMSSEVRRMTELFDNEDVELELNIDKGEFFVNGDQKLMGRIVSNLIINGMQSVPDGKRPQIKINLKTRNNKISLEVKDNGDGFVGAIKDLIRDYVKSGTTGLLFGPDSETDIKSTIAEVQKVLREKELEQLKSSLAKLSNKKNNLRSIYFDFDKSTIKEESKLFLIEVAKVLKTHC